MVLGLGEKEGKLGCSLVAGLRDGPRRERHVFGPR